MTAINRFGSLNPPGFVTGLFTGFSIGFFTDFFMRGSLIRGNFMPGSLMGGSVMRGSLNANQRFRFWCSAVFTVSRTRVVAAGRSPGGVLGAVGFAITGWTVGFTRMVENANRAEAMPITPATIPDSCA